MIDRFVKLLATLWRRSPQHCAPPPPQCADPSPQCAPAWTDYRQDRVCCPRALALAFARWARSQPEFAGQMLNAQYVKDLYLEAASQHWPWPPYRDFARELGLIMPRKRVWRQRQALTVYAVQPREIVQLAQRRA